MICLICEQVRPDFSFGGTADINVRSYRVSKHPERTSCFRVTELYLRAENTKFLSEAIASVNYAGSIAELFFSKSFVSSPGLALNSLRAGVDPENAVAQLKIILFSICMKVRFYRIPVF